MHSTIIEISQKQFIANILAIQQWLKRNSNNRNIKTCLPVKANAYGHGLLPIATIAAKYVDYLAVACASEGKLLRQYGITIPILVFGYFSCDEIEELILNGLDFTIASYFKAKEVEAICQKYSLTCNVHLKIDTGMNRVGIRAENAYGLIEYVRNSPYLNLVGVYSHLASSEVANDDFTFRQIAQFREIAQFTKQLKNNIICHLANSGGVCHYPDSYLDMVRPGILSYGYLPIAISNNNNNYLYQHVKPCFSLKSKVIYFKVVGAYQPISYNQKYITSTQSRVVTVPIGYGDGYPRALSNCGEVLIHGQKFTIAGNICMDMLMVDIGSASAYIEDEVVLIGSQGQQTITVDSIANKCHTINYEILCGFTERIPRVII